MALSVWSILLSKKMPTFMSAAQSDKPDAYAEDVTAVIMTKQGKPSLLLETPKMVHYPKSDLTEITTPHVVVYRQTLQPWHVNANHAKSFQGTSRIVFWDHVVINHIADNDNPRTTVQTPTLTIFPDQQLAKTDEAILFTQPFTTIHAVGMLANLDEGTIKLLSQAKEEYVPKS